MSNGTKDKQNKRIKQQAYQRNILSLMFFFDGIEETNKMDLKVDTQY